MSAYATIEDVEKRILRTLSADEKRVCQSYLDDSAVIIDAFNKSATAESKLVVSCRMVIRALGDGEPSGVPIGASQGSQSALGYSQSWTMGTGGNVGELYLSKLDKQTLGYGNQIGSHSPVEDITEKKND